MLCPVHVLSLVTFTQEIKFINHTQDATEQQRAAREVLFNPERLENKTVCLVQERDLQLTLAGDHCRTYLVISGEGNIIDKVGGATWPC
jgi:hypothetical protein